MLRRMLLAILALTVPALAAEPATPTEDFAFVQFTDLHLNPHLARSGPPGPLRGAETIAWICREAVGPQHIPVLGITTPAPAFALVTGDITEYGVIDDTWSLFEKAFQSLPYPLYVLPGNHDNTWVAMYHVMRERHGGENYSFDRFGCHFACICSASPQEPVPTIDAKTRAWLTRDLEDLPPGTPVFVALHHPPYSNEFANPAEYDTFIDLLRDHNVVLMLYGHGHGVSHRKMDGIDGVMGGSTFGKNAGYAVISVQDGMLRVAYRYQREPGDGGENAGGPAWKTLLEKPLRRVAPERLFRIAARSTAISDAALPDLFTVAVEPTAGHERAEWADVTIRIDGDKVASEPIRSRADPSRTVLAPGLTPGRHLLSVRARTANGLADLRTATFVSDGAGPQCVWRKEFPAAVKAGPVLADSKLIVAGTDGVVRALERSSGAQLWAFKTGGEILGTPAWSGQVLVFGSGDGKVYALDGSGKRVWTFDAGLPVYGWPLIEGETVYIGDNGGRLHALDLGSGKPRWTFSRADYSIECPPCLWDELVVFGAWDGYVYALDRNDGALRWKSLGPKSSEGKAARYYAPADCGPVVLGDTLFVCDRGYQLGAYSATGELKSKQPAQTSAIERSEDGRSLYARTTDDRVCKLNERGEALWRVQVPAGRFPVPPIERGGKVYICSNRGRLSVLDGRDGRLLWTYQTTSGFYVMAPLAVGASGPDHARAVCYVAGMDGSVTAVRARKNSHPAPRSAPGE